MGEPTLTRVVDDTLHARLRAAREQSPTAVDPTTGAVVALRHVEVERLSRDPRVHGVGLSFFDFMGIADGPLRRWYGSLMFTNEGDAHDRLRRLVVRAFTPRAVERHRAFASALARARLDALVAAGGGDLVDAFADVPLAVICRLLGVPEADTAGYLAHTDALSRVFGLMDAAEVRSATEALAALNAVVANLLAARRATRADDLVSALLEAEDAGDRLTHDEVVTMVGNLIVGGHDTTASQIGCTLLTILRHPELLAALQGGRASAADVVAESIRHEPSIPFVPRTLSEPVEVGGVERPAGTMLYLSSASANRDAAVWHDPDAVRPDRFADPAAPRLLSFGSGTHYCLGAALARMTLEAVVTELGATTPLVPTFDLRAVEWKQVLGRGPAHLPVAPA